MTNKSLIVVFASVFMTSMVVADDGIKDLFKERQRLIDTQTSEASQKVRLDKNQEKLDRDEEKLSNYQPKDTENPSFRSVVSLIKKTSNLHEGEKKQQADIQKFTEDESKTTKDLSENTRKLQEAFSACPTCAEKFKKEAKRTKFDFAQQGQSTDQPNPKEVVNGAGTLVDKRPEAAATPPTAEIRDPATEPAADSAGTQTP